MSLSLGFFIKLFILLVVLFVVLVVVGGVYIAVLAGVNIPGLTGAFRTEGEPVSAEVLTRARQVEDKIDNSIRNKSGFYLELTDQEVTDLLLSKIDPSAQIRNAEVKITPEEVGVSGNLNGRVAVPFSGGVGLTLDKGEIAITLNRISVGALPMPGFAKSEIQPVIDEVLDLNETLRESGATQIQQLKLEQGKATIVGVQRDGETVSTLTTSAFLNALASSGPRPDPVAPGADIVPPGTTAGKPGSEIYLALGDSLAANVGVSDPRNGYVSRFHGYLERETGRSIGLTNLGISGESTISIQQSGQLDQALDILDQSSPSVSFLTLDLGANDLLAHLGSSDCQTDPRGAPCQARVDAAIETFESNFESIVEELDSRLDSDAEFYIMTIYNPFDFGIGLPFEAFSNEILDRMNTIIRDTAASVGAEVAEAYPIMQGNAAAWTHMLEGDIHPTAEGFQALAFSFAQAREQ